MEAARVCPAGYRELTITECQEIMGQAATLARISATIDRLKAEQREADLMTRAIKAELKAALSDLAVAQRSTAETNRRLGIHGAGDLLEGDGYAYLRVNSSKPAGVKP